MKRWMAFDVGGTYFRWKSERGSGKMPTKSVKLEAIQNLLKSQKIERLAISYAGQVCCNRPLSAPNVELSFSLDALEPLVDELIVENDLKCAALAHRKHLGWKEFVLLFCGTGLGGAAMERGRLIRGFRNLALEIGHIPYRSSPFVCGCGKSNCIELFASGKGLRLWGERLGSPWEFELASEELRELFLEALAHGAGVLLSLCNPERLVLGGGVIEHNEAIVEELGKRIATYAPSFALGARILRSPLRDASLLGAEILARRDDEDTL